MKQGSRWFSSAWLIFIILFHLDGFGQTFTTLFNFTNYMANAAHPEAGLVWSSNVLYGTTSGGGDDEDDGTVFRVATDGTGYAVLHSFTNSPDGSEPWGNLALSGNVLYGTTLGGGGSAGDGTIFKINTDGSGYKVLYAFSNLDINFDTNTDGSSPHSGLVVSGNMLYGTTSSGGFNGGGTLFALTTNGSGFSALHQFTNSPDGYNAVAGLTLSNSILYGTTELGGTNGVGTIFKINVNGSGYALLHTFSRQKLNSAGFETNSDGAEPLAGLVVSGGALYGTAYVGGNWDNGTVFKLNTNGSGFTPLYSFTTNSADGNEPDAGVVVSGSQIYGTTHLGGVSDIGIVFTLNTNGTGYTVLHEFTNAPDGFEPEGGLILSGTDLFGTTLWGGTSGGGMVFDLSLASPVVAPLVLTNFGVASRQFHLTVIGPTGSNAVVSASTDLHSWSPLTTNVLTSGTLSLTDNVSTNFPKRFYRANLQ